MPKMADGSLHFNHVLKASFQNHRTVQMLTIKSDSSFKMAATIFKSAVLFWFMLMDTCIKILNNSTRFETDLDYSSLKESSWQQLYHPSF